MGAGGRRRRRGEGLDLNLISPARARTLCDAYQPADCPRPARTKACYLHAAWAGDLLMPIDQAR